MLALFAWLGSSGFSRRWTYDLPRPFTPLSVGVACGAGIVAVGSRDCPDNTLNRLDYLDLRTGKHCGMRNGSASNMALAHHAAAGGGALVAGVGWHKPSHTTVLSHLIVGRPNGPKPKSWSERFKGDPAMWIPSAISADGAVSALLVEPTPDLAHLNNRSGLLLLFGDGPKPAYRLELAGLGPMDPQSVAISARACGGVYTIGALIGKRTLLVDYNAAASKGAVVFDAPQGEGLGPENVIGISSDGRMFAVGDGTSLTVYERAASGSGRFARLASILPPKSPGVLDLAPNGVAFSSQPSGAPLLATSWVSESGAAVAASAHLVSASAVHDVWSHTVPCATFTMAVSHALAVSDDGAWVALGSWGCSSGDGGGGGASNVFIWQGVGGDGTPMYKDARPGQVWAVDVQTCADNTTAVAIASWSTDGVPSQLSVYTRSEGRTGAGAGGGAPQAPELIGLVASSSSEGQLVIADALSGRVRATHEDRAAAGTAASAFDCVSNTLWLFEEGYILHPFYIANRSFGAHTLVNLDNCTAGGACLQELHWRNTTQSILALSLGWSGQAAVLELSPHTGLIVATRARLPSLCGIFEGGTALHEGDDHQAATLFITLDCYSKPDVGAAIYAFDLRTGANTTLRALPHTKSVPLPLIWTDGAGLIGAVDGQLVHVGGDAIGPIPASIPAGSSLRTGSLAASARGLLYVGLRTANATGRDGGAMPVVVLDARANFSTVAVLEGFRAMALLAIT